jgi:hypothetical protein
VFRPVTLRDYTPSSNGLPREDLVVYDGGPIDNLGITTLVDVLRAADHRSGLESLFPKGCRIIAVDATPRPAAEPDAYLPAASVLLYSNRREVLERVGFPTDRLDRARFGSFSVNGNGYQCRLWHVALRQLQDNDPLGARVTRIQTNLGLSQEDQAALIAAAKRLVEESQTAAQDSDSWAQVLGPAAGRNQRMAQDH